MGFTKKKDQSNINMDKTVPEALHAYVLFVKIVLNSCFQQIR